nr:hypothetical protein [Planctomicrobium piriforme]
MKGIKKPIVQQPFWLRFNTVRLPRFPNLTRISQFRRRTKQPLGIVGNGKQIADQRVGLRYGRQVVTTVNGQCQRSQPFPTGCVESVSRFDELDFARLSAIRISKIIFDGNPVRLILIGTRNHKYDRGVAAHPVVEVSFITKELKTGVCLGLEIAVSGLALHLDDAVRYFCRYGVPDFDDPVNACFKMQRVPDKAHVVDDAMDESDSFVARHIGSSDLLVLGHSSSSLTLIHAAQSAQSGSTDFSTVAC